MIVFKGFEFILFIKRRSYGVKDRPKITVHDCSNIYRLISFIKELICYRFFGSRVFFELFICLFYRSTSND